MAQWASRWREAAPARPTKPTSAGPAERFQRAVRIEYFDACARPRVDIVERLMACALFGVGNHRMPPLRESRHNRVREDIFQNVQSWLVVLWSYPIPWGTLFSGRQYLSE
jgi:hypothetical protein